MKIMSVLFILENRISNWNSACEYDRKRKSRQKIPIERALIAHAKYIRKHLGQAIVESVHEKENH